MTTMATATAAIDTWLITEAPPRSQSGPPPGTRHSNRKDPGDTTMKTDCTIGRGPGGENHGMSESLLAGTLIEILRAL